jgi:23S rRNA (pseudouridine1915-N3)-methyltransferase
MTILLPLLPSVALTLLLLLGTMSMSRALLRTTATTIATNANGKSRRSSLIARHLTTNILIVGKKNGAEPWIEAGIEEYEKRLTGSVKFKTTFLKSDAELIKSVQATKGAILALDEYGKQYPSIEFSKLFHEVVQEGGAQVTFVIGGFAGLPSEIRDNYKLISLSKMTWTHQMVRLLITEQVYRATEIYKGSNYHKE